MSTFIRVVAGFLLIAHGLVHLLYLAPDVKEFSFEDPWLVARSAAHTVGAALMVTTIAAFVLLGLAVWGVPWLAGVWPAIAVVAGTCSLVLLIAFWDPHLVFGVALDIALIALAVLRPEWTQQIG